MAGFVTAAYVVAGSTAALSMYSSSQANSRADSIADSQNASNTAANNRSVALAEQDNADRKAELLKRFNISSSKMADTSQDINTGLATKLTSLNMELVKAQSVTDNTLATGNITGRLAERLRNTSAIQGSMAKGNAIQDTDAQLKDLGSKLETMATDKETQDLNLDIDTSSAITAANNQLVSNYAYSNSTGLAGTVATGISTGMSTYSAVK